MDPTNLDFWNEGADLQSQPDTFAISFTETAPFSTLDLGSVDFFDSALPSANDPFQVADNGCQASLLDSDEISQNVFDEMSGPQIDVRSDLKTSSIRKLSQRNDLALGDLGQGPHDCAGAKIAACCASDEPEVVVVQDSMRLRPVCLLWGKCDETIEH